MQDMSATHHWIATLDDLAWLLNLRGADVDYNPVFLGHAPIGLDQNHLVRRRRQGARRLARGVAAMAFKFNPMSKHCRR